MTIRPPINQGLIDQAINLRKEKPNNQSFNRPSIEARESINQSIHWAINVTQVNWSINQSTEGIHIKNETVQ